MIIVLLFQARRVSVDHAVRNMVWSLTPLGTHCKYTCLPNLQTPRMHCITLSGYGVKHMRLILLLKIY